MQRAFKLSLGSRGVVTLLICDAQVIVVGRVRRGSIGGFLQQIDRQPENSFVHVCPGKRIGRIRIIRHGLASGLCERQGDVGIAAVLQENVSKIIRRGWVVWLYGQGLLIFLLRVLPIALRFLQRTEQNICADVSWILPDRPLDTTLRPRGSSRARLRGGQQQNGIHIVGIDIERLG